MVVCFLEANGPFGERLSDCEGGSSVTPGLVSQYVRLAGSVNRFFCGRSDASFARNLRLNDFKSRNER